MQKPNYKNELAKREFFSYLKDSDGYSDNSIASFEKAILLWEDFDEGADFSTFDDKQAKNFKEWLKAKKRKGSEATLSLSYCYDMLRHLKKFFDWLSKQPNYKSKINPNHIGFLNLSKKDTTAATQVKTGKIPSMDELKQVLDAIKGKTEVERRDRALISLPLLTAGRISAIISLPMKSFDRAKLIVTQDPNDGVKTKFSKRIVTRLFSLSYDKPLTYFLDWFDYLATERHFTPNDPIFPTTKLERGTESISFFSSGKVEPKFWSHTGTARKIFEKRFKQAGVPYYHPHTLRHLVIKEFAKNRLTEEEKKAISQNIGHENIGTTFGTYGYTQISEDRQIDLIKGIDFKDRETKDFVKGLGEEDIRRILKEELKKSGK